MCINSPPLLTLGILISLACKPDSNSKMKADISTQRVNFEDFPIGVPETNEDLQKVTEATLQQAQATISGEAPCPPRENGDPDDCRWEQQFALRVTEANQVLNTVTFAVPYPLIAILDSGIQRDHEDLESSLTTEVAHYNAVADNQDVTDVNGHGTSVAGILAATRNNGKGIVGVCPVCRLLIIKVLSDYNVGTFSGVAAGIRYAVDNGAAVINLSLGSTIDSSTVREAIEYAVAKGVILVAAAGNFVEKQPYYPAAYPGVIAVGATDVYDQIWERSNTGDFLDVVAPGVYVLSTYKHDPSTEEKRYEITLGTSFAAPHVSGLAGLLLAKDPSLSAEQVTELIVSGAVDLGASGCDDIFGQGRINIRASIKHFSPHVLHLLQIMNAK